MTFFCLLGQPLCAAGTVQRGDFDLGDRVVERRDEHALFRWVCPLAAVIHGKERRSVLRPARRIVGLGQFVAPQVGERERQGVRLVVPVKQAALRGAQRTKHNGGHHGESEHDADRPCDRAVDPARHLFTLEQLLDALYDEHQHQHVQHHDNADHAQQRRACCQVVQHLQYERCPAYGEHNALEQAGVGCVDKFAAGGGFFRAGAPA